MTLIISFASLRTSTLYPNSVKIGEKFACRSPWSRAAWCCFTSRARFDTATGCHYTLRAYRAASSYSHCTLSIAPLQSAGQPPQPHVTYTFIGFYHLWRVGSAVLLVHNISRKYTLMGSISCTIREMRAEISENFCLLVRKEIINPIAIERTRRETIYAFQLDFFRRKPIRSQVGRHRRFDRSRIRCVGKNHAHVWVSAEVYVTRDN